MPRALRQRLQFFSMSFAATLVLAVSARPAEACSCLPPTVESSYNQSTDVVSARVLGTFNQGSNRMYLAQVETPYKGCLDVSDLVILTTPQSSASCGIQLQLGVEHLINGLANGSLLGIRRLSIGLCGYNLPVAELGEQDREFLNGRNVCCGKDCECADGSSPVACFADPCSVTPACSEAATCVANYCGGCNAEFYDENGYAVCLDPSACQTDEDCPSGEWCRQAAPAASNVPPGSFGPPPPPVDDAPVYECVPFVAEGEPCNGFTLPWSFERCQPGLVCDTPPFLADAPGVCHAPCTSDDGCAIGEYCASDGACDTDGRCELSVDCNLEGNSYIHPACVGYGVCPQLESECGWQCGNPACVDTFGYDFGPCDAVLGWAVQNGECVLVSGCGGGPFSFFSSQASCEQACEEPPAMECQPGEVTPTDECGNVCSCTEAGRWICTLLPCILECGTDSDCQVTGCSGQVCAPEPVFTTCEWRDEYACYQDPAITSCGCTAGRCAWAPTPELKECLASAGVAR